MQIFGQGFVSTGGFTTTKEFVGYLDLKPEQYVLDVGSGIGGGPFYMAKVSAIEGASRGCGDGLQEFGVKVRGIDLSSNMTQIARERHASSGAPIDQVSSYCTALHCHWSHGTQVQFTIADVTQQDYPEAMFDVIYRSVSPDAVHTCLVSSCSRDTILHIQDKATLFKKFLVRASACAVLCLISRRNGSSPAASCSSQTTAAAPRSPRSCSRAM